MSHVPVGLVLNIHTDPDSIQAAFLRRAMSALERISANVSAKDLADALAAPTDAGSLAQLLSHSEMVGSAVTDLDPLVPALARNVEHRQQLLARAGGAVSADEAGRILGISRQAVDKRRRTGALLAVREGSDWRYPACQFDQGETVAGIADVVRGFSAAGPWIALDFLLAPDAVLGGRTPLAALRAGERDAVARLVRAEGSDGFA
ncbi:MULTISPECIES: helix-turn-helix domain-containing protein [Rhizobium/Agrobacterium group]|uniref:Helix-turn-helix domain-containing protein n=2 Tax=Neorhizobium TaxID=1525371 RepID=A0ABV0MCL9_9HYPH|nr:MULTISPECIES: helix-turn-helix domain-containing protein [Rhizobium/Agrobacterium group]KGD94053.1 DNA-binding protein [Rhizobium sp. YS-1r]MCC2613868.1 helix-turn-helix domain-containing protein [Neorhizobium petrolearium]WGI71392.1 helix-turn-helix domain-containing protein [Neorhizobium petrolearium]